MQAVDGPNSSQLEWHQIGVKTTAADPSKFGDEKNYGTREWRAAIVADYLNGKEPSDWTEPSLKVRLVKGMSDALISELQDVRTWVATKKLPPES